MTDLQSIALKLAPAFVNRNLDTIAGILAVLPDDEAEAWRRIEDLREAFWMEVQEEAER